MVFAPEPKKPPKNALNLWQGYRRMSETPESAEQLKAFILDII